MKRASDTSGRPALSLAGPAIILATTLLACGGEGPEAAGDDDQGMGGAGGSAISSGGMGGAGGVAAQPVTFDAVHDTVLVSAGCVYGCHDASASGNLMLAPGEGGTPEPDMAYGALVGVVSTSLACDGWPLIVPGAPEESLLWLKLAAEVGTPGIEICGEAMPKGSGSVDPSQVDLVGDWIADGAPR